MGRKKKSVAPSMTPDKVRQVQELRRSNATRQTDTTTRAEKKRRAIEEES